MGKMTNIISFASRQTWVVWLEPIYRNLFGNLASSLITILITAGLFFLLPPLINWSVINSVWSPAEPEACRKAAGACWAFVQLKMRVILFGRYNYAEQWRPALSMLIVLAAIIVSADWRQWKRSRWGWILVGIWCSAIFLSCTFMFGGIFGLPYVGIDRWGGLPLTLLLAILGIIIAFLLGVFLALGRRSDLPIISWLCTGYIEIVRGVPLITILYMSVVFFPMLIPPELHLHKVFRALIAFSIFFSAYLAEVVRGGLQGVSKGQYEAADSVGLNYWQTMRWIIMPQVLKISIPSIVNVFLNAFKDTSLVVIISMFDLLGTTNAVVQDPKWSGVFVETYVFSALIYFIFCFSISKYSQKLEEKLDNGADI